MQVAESFFMLNSPNSNNCPHRLTCYRICCVVYVVRRAWTLYCITGVILRPRLVNQRGFMHDPVTSSTWRQEYACAFCLSWYDATVDRNKYCNMELMDNGYLLLINLWLRWINLVLFCPFNLYFFLFLSSWLCCVESGYFHTWSHESVWQI